MRKKLKLSTLFLLAAACVVETKIFALDDIVLSKESYDKIYADEFVNEKKTFAEAEPFFDKKEFDVPQLIAFEDETIRLTPGDVIKISEELTFSDWGGAASSKQIAAEDFTLPADTIKKMEEGEAKTKNIKFSRTPF